MKRTIACIIGTRPELIKMVPIIKALRATSWAKSIVIHTGQHQALTDPMYALFNIKPDINLNVLKADQTLAELTANLLLRLNEVFLSQKFDMVISQGDTSSTFTAALISYYYQIPFAHVEAGLRTYRPYHPFPEEANRILVARLASLHFAPTEYAKKHLIKEKISKTSIYVTGNTIVDSLLNLNGKEDNLPCNLKSGQQLILVTSHRRENLGEPLHNICKAIMQLVQQNSNIRVIFPVHANLRVKEIVNCCLGHHSQITVCPALAYPQFIATLKACHLVLTDSGGIQEEASVLGKPILILREVTERQEIVMAGLARIVGTQTEKIVEETQKILNDPALYTRMAQGCSLYGDGNASKKIVDIINKFFAIQYA